MFAAPVAAPVGFAAAQSKHQNNNKKEKQTNK